MAPVRKRAHVRLSRGAAAAALAGAICFGSLSLAAQSATNPEIVVNPGRYGSYYHLRFELTAAAIDFPRSDRAARSGGQFELRIRPDRFPVPAPACRGSIILRMPWTAPDAREASKKIAAKETLLKRILALEQSPSAVVPVVIELNPYVEVVSRGPLQLRLTQCNVYFRQAAGGYVDHTGPVEPIGSR